ncbi:4747_t:CDS:10 [Diversispora eburnea]|uniref:4747_t:CDS:1 n=1 Tax=Diversispora eburnea TaxID=1213867 RepID=A0A9N8YM34_9GLOM|nr:4747_t:CDS:10 [Diversispora eburnea]
MADFTVDQSAIVQLIELGVPASRAKEALMKYNNNVNHAANYYFENPGTDPEETPHLAPLTSDESTSTEWNNISTWNQDSTTNHTLGSGLSNIMDTTVNDSKTTSNNDQEMQNAINASIIESNKESLTRALNESMQSDNMMQLVKYNNNKDDNDPQSIQESYHNENRTWTDPEQPSKRVKLDTAPIGLRPSNSYHYANSFLQALFHLPIFRLSLLAFRPTKNEWGEIEGYWKGKNKKTYDNHFGHRGATENSGIMNRQSALKFIHEFQKLFGFLSLSRRSYGDSSLLLDALNFEEKTDSWGDSDPVGFKFITKLLKYLRTGSVYRDQFNVEQKIPDNMTTYNLNFDRLFKSYAKDGVSRKFEITTTNNTIYAALDQLVQESSKGNSRKYFTELAHILIMNLKHRSDNYSSFMDSSFQIQKDIHMDRYLSENSENVEERMNQIENMKRELEETIQQIDKIIKFQGKHNGLELLKGSIDHFRWKCDKTNDDESDSKGNSQRTLTWLEGILNKVEQKLNALLQKKDELERRIKNAFNTPDMVKCLYSLKSILVYDGQRQHWAYIWVSKDRKKDKDHFSTTDDGRWIKFMDTNVEAIDESVIYNEIINYRSNIVHTLIYVDSMVDVNFSNITDVIPISLKEFVEKDNLEIILNQAIRLESRDPKILRRIEFFCAKVECPNIIEVLLINYKTGALNLAWDEPIPFHDGYYTDPRFTNVIKAYDQFKNITRYIIEGLEQSLQDSYSQALGYFCQAIKLEKLWIKEIAETNADDDNAPKMNAKNLARSDFILKLAKVCLTVANNPAFVSGAADSALFVLKVCLDLFEIKACSKDKLIDDQWKEWVTINSAMQYQQVDQNTLDKLRLLVESLASVRKEILPDLPSGLGNEYLHVDSLNNFNKDEDLYQRYSECLKKCKQIPNFSKIL